MAYRLRLPDLGEGVAEGEIRRWLVEVGQEVREDDPLLEVQTDKAAVEIPSPASGVVSRILAEKAILDLHAPVIRVTGYDVPYPYWQIEDAYMPSVERVAAAVRKVIEF